MNKKKMIFLGALVFLILIIIIIILSLTSQTNNNKKKLSSNNFKIWLLNDDKDNFLEFINDFKTETKNTNFNPVIESFSNYDEYNLALASAIIKGEAPDLYMLNNNEKSLFLENAIGIDPEIISPDEMREGFNSFFGDDLIISSGEDDKKIEFLIGVPFGFETLGLYYNIRRVFDASKIKSFPKIANFIDTFNSEHSNKVALGIGGGDSVYKSNDIFTQFLLSTGEKNIFNLSANELKSAFSMYFDFSSGKNNYSTINKNLLLDNKTNINAFVDGDIAMIFGYPRLLYKIDELGFKKSHLRVTPFPDFIDNSDKLVNYNYFVLNKNSQNKDMAYSLLSYIFSEKGEKALLDQYKYYIPARISLYSEIKDRNISDAFYIKLKNFYSKESLYYSFDKGIKIIYDGKIKKILNNKTSYLEKGLKFVDSSKCKSKKILDLENLNKNCD